MRTGLFIIGMILQFILYIWAILAAFGLWGTVGGIILLLSPVVGSAVMFFIIWAKFGFTLYCLVFVVAWALLIIGHTASE